MVELLLHIGVLVALPVVLLRAAFLLIPSPLVQRWLAAIARRLTKLTLRAIRVLAVLVARKGYQWSLAGVEWLARRWNDHWQP